MSNQLIVIVATACAIPMVVFLEALLAYEDDIKTLHGVE